MQLLWSRAGRTLRRAARRRRIHSNFRRRARDRLSRPSTGALSHPQGRTIAVLGSGIDVPYPPENAALFKQIAAEGRGVVVSEYPIGTPPLRDNFPRRNRIVSGLSRGVLVIEADTRSGALITARQAGDDHARTVFALPGRVDNALSDGPHQLIRDGAVLTTKLEDIIEGLGPLPHAVGLAPMLFEQQPTEMPVAKKPSASLSERQQLILTHLDGDSVHVDALIEAAQHSAPAIGSFARADAAHAQRRSPSNGWPNIRAHRRLAVNVRYDHVSVFVVRVGPKGFEYLQLRRRKGDYLGGTWQTVRGSAEPGETSIQTALRELCEETGFVPTEFYSLGIVETFHIAASDTLYFLFHSPTFVAVVDAATGVVLDPEHDAHRWIEAADATRLFMWPSEGPVAARELSQKFFATVMRNHICVSSEALALDFRRVLTKTSHIRSTYGRSHVACQHSSNSTSSP